MRVFRQGGGCATAGEGDGGGCDVEELGDFAQAIAPGFPQEQEEDVASGAGAAAGGSTPGVGFFPFDSQGFLEALDDVADGQVGRALLGVRFTVAGAFRGSAAQPADAFGAAQDSAVPNVLEKAVTLLAVPLGGFSEGVGVAVEEGKDVIATEPGAQPLA